MYMYLLGSLMSTTLAPVLRVETEKPREFDKLTTSGALVDILREGCASCY